MLKWYQRIRALGQDMKKQNISAFAASIAFFFFLSLVPMLVVICTILPYTPLTEANLLTALNDLIPDKIFPFVQGLVQDVYALSEGLLPIAVIVTLWTAGKGMLALMRGLNGVGAIEETRNFLWVRCVACFYTVLMLFMVLLSLIVTVFGNRLVELLFYKLPKIKPLVELIMHFRFLAVWILLMLLFASIYSYVPNGRLKFREQIPGAAFTAVGWSGFSFGFSFYVDRADYSIYGSLALIVLIMLWLYFCMYIVMVGAYFNRYFQPVNQEIFAKKDAKKRRK